MHGLPIGSCPICNGMAGGGAKKADFSAKPGEMSWNECAAIGAFLRAQKLARQTQLHDAQNFAQKLQNFQKNLDTLHAQIVKFNTILNEKLPRIISLPVAYIVKVVLQTPISVIKTLPQVIFSINSKIADVSSKITALIGEFKTAVYKKISENFAEFKKKIKSLFSIFETLNLSNQDKKIDEEKRAFNLKRFLLSLIRKEHHDETP